MNKTVKFTALCAGVLAGISLFASCAPAEAPANAGNTASAGIVMSEKEAKKLAFDAAGVSEADVEYAVITESTEGKPKYEIEFTVNGTEYEYEIDKTTGGILEVDSETSEKIPVPANPEEEKPAPEEPVIPQKPENPADTFIDADTAQFKVMEYTGFSPADCTIKDTDFKEFPDGAMAYEIEFYHKNTEYTAYVDAYTGEVLEVREDAEQETEYNTDTP